MALRITGTQQIATSSETIGSGATVFSTSCWVRLNSLLSGSVTEHLIFGEYGGYPWRLDFQQGSNAGFNALFPILSNNFAEDVISSQVSYHVAMVWTPGLQTVYINGQVLGTGSTAGGFLSGYNSHLQFGGTTNGNADPAVTGVDFEVEHAAIWVGYALTQNDVLALRDQTQTPNQIALSNLKFYMTLQGTTGAAVKTSDAGLTDVTGTITGITITGSPTYAAPLTYIPPVIATPTIGPGGDTLIFNFTKTINGTPSIGAYDPGPNTYFPIISGIPSFSVNGGTPTPLMASPVTVTGTTTSGSAAVTGVSSMAGIEVGMAVTGTGLIDFAAVVSIDSATQFTISYPAYASGTISMVCSFSPYAELSYAIYPLPVTVKSTDVVTVTAPSQWASTNDGSCGPLNATANNLTAGSLYPAFQSSPTKTMKLGYNVPGAIFYFPVLLYANICRQAAFGWLDEFSTCTQDSNGNIVSFNVVGAGVNLGLPSAQDNGSGDAKGNYQCPDGVYTLMYDLPISGGLEPTFTLTDNNSTITAVGTNITGQATNNQIQWNVIGNGLVYYKNLTLSLHGPQSTGLCGARNIRLYYPGGGNGLFSNDYLRMLGQASCLRFMDAFGINSCNLTDYASQWSPTSNLYIGGNRVQVTLSLTSVAPWANTDRWFPQTAANSGDYYAPDDTGPFAVFTIAPNDPVTGQPISLVDGWTLVFGQNVTLAMTGTSQSSLAISGGSYIIHVLSSTTFAIALNARSYGAINGTQSLTGVTATMVIRNVMPISDAVSLCTTPVVRDFHMNVPALSTNTSVAAQAAAVFSAGLTTGSRLIVEYMNEHWNMAFPQSVYLCHMFAVRDWHLVTQQTAFLCDTAWVECAFTGSSPATLVFTNPAGTWTSGSTPISVNQGTIVSQTFNSSTQFTVVWNPPTYGPLYATFSDATTGKTLPVAIDPGLLRDWWYAYQTSNVHAIVHAQAVTSGWSGTVVRAFGSWFGSVQVTQNIVQYCRTYSKPIDMILIAPYYDGPGESNTIPTFDLFSLNQLHTCNALYLQNTPSYVSKAGTHVDALNNGTGSGGAGFPSAVVACYEGDYESADLNSHNAGVNSRTFPLHPLALPFELQFYQQLANQGITLLNTYISVGPIGISYNAPSGGPHNENQNVLYWPAYSNTTQRAGKGDGSDGLFNNTTNFGAQNQIVSVRGYAANTWMTAAGQGTGAATPSFFSTPTGVSAGKSTTLTLTGSNTSWTSSTTFTVSSGTVTAKTITSATQATITFTAPSSAGTVTITDSSSGATATVSVVMASLAITPTTVASGSTATLTLTGTGTSWTSSTTFAVSAGTITATSVKSATQATITVTAPSASGNLTVTDNSTGATATVSVVLASFSIAPTSVTSASTNTLTLTGTTTGWSSSTTFTVSAGTITSKTITSATLATVTYVAPVESSATVVTFTDSVTGATGSLSITVPLASTTRRPYGGFRAHARSLRGHSR